MFHSNREWPPWLAPAIVLVSTVISGLFGALFLSGCGGGGGGNPPPNREHRSVNAVGNNVSTTVGSRFHKTVTLFWVGDNTGTNYGKAKIESFAKTAGTGDLTLDSADGTLDLANDLANDTFRFTFVARHPVGSGDPDQNAIENGTASVVITPQDPRINPLSSLTIPQGGSVNLAAEAQNSRLAGSYKIVRASSSRVFVGTSASWSVSPVNAGSFGSNPAEVGSFQASPSFAGDATVTATILGSNERVTAVVHVIPHPSVAISSPTEGQEVSGTINVLFSAANANSVTYRVDNGSDIVVTGQSSFALDTTTLTNAPHSITMRAVGQLETATITRNVTVKNGVALKDGKMVLNGPPIQTNSDGQNIPNFIGGRNVDGRMYAFGFSRLTLLSSTGQVTNRIIVNADNAATAMLGDKSLICVPDMQHGQLLIYDFAGSLVKTVGGMGFVQSADYLPGQPILTASSTGLTNIDSVTWNKTFVLAGSFSMASGNASVIFATEFGNGGKTAIYNYSGTKIKDLGWIGNVQSIRIVPGWNLAIVSVSDGPQGTGVYQYKLDGTLIEFNSFGIPSGKTWRGFDRNWQQADSLYGAMLDASLQPFKVQ